MLDNMGWEIQIPVKSGCSGVYEGVELLCFVCLKLKSTGEILVVKERERVLREKSSIRKGIKRTERDRDINFDSKMHSA